MKKVVVITGASSGMGKDAALRLLQEGYCVYGLARRLEKMQAIVAAGGHALKLDIRDEAAIHDAVAQILREQGRIDVLWNNAGYAEYGAVEDVPLEAARRQFEVNLFGLAAMTKAVVPSMRAQHAGLIINTSSIGGKIYSPLGAWYHASKHALEGWSDCLRLELAHFGIKVVILEPGAIRTEFIDVMLEPMLERSQGGPYQAVVEKIAASMKKAQQNPNAASPPSVISDAIVHIIRAKKPHNRYAVGKMARAPLFIRKWFGDALYDRGIKRMMGL